VRNLHKSKGIAVKSVGQLLAWLSIFERLLKIKFKIPCEKCQQSKVKNGLSDQLPFLLHFVKNQANQIRPNL
jgi:hypothetical protein